MNEHDLLIPTEGDLSPISPANGNDYTLREAQAWVGGYVEIVRLTVSPGASPETEWLLVVNEDGLAMQLPHNARASAIAGRYIVGPAALVQGARFK